MSDEISREEIAALLARESMSEEMTKAEQIERLQNMQTLTDGRDYEVLQAAITALSAEPMRWIPVEEYLPDKLENVLIVFEPDSTEFDVAYRRKTFNATYKKCGAEDEWVSVMGDTTYADYEVQAWMNIPIFKRISGKESE